VTLALSEQGRIEGFLAVKDWAEIRRLYRSEGLPIQVVAWIVGVSRNTVKRGLASARPPKCQCQAKGSTVDAVEPQIREFAKGRIRASRWLMARPIPTQHAEGLFAGWRLYSCFRFGPRGFGLRG
jgi:predicted DNA-binding protein (UPF0251 family)